MYMTRKEIYDHIWTRTVQGFAEDYSLNYPMLLRRINEEEIPRPSRREILFIRQGEEGLRAIRRPELQGDPSKTVRLTRRRDAGPIPEQVESIASGTSRSSQQNVSPVTSEETDRGAELFDYEHHPRWSGLYFLNTAERRRVIRETEAIRVHREKLLHPRVLKLQREVAAFQSQTEILGSEEMATSVGDRPALLDHISLDSVVRVLGILDSLYCSVEFLGGTVKEDGAVLLHGQEVKLSFSESRAREAVAPSVHDEVSGDSPRFTMRYTGKLTLSVGYLYSIHDRKKERLEDRLGDALELLYLTAFQLSQNEKRKHPGEEMGSFNIELERTEELIQQAKDYRDAENIRALLKAVQKKLSTGELEYQDYWPTWAAWASGKAEWLDPTIGRKDDILGRRHESILKPPKRNS